MTDLDDLSKKIDAAKKHREKSPENMVSANNSTGDEGMSFGMRVGVELFAGVLVGALIGYFLDRAFNTLPLFLVIFVLIGAAAGFWSIYKSFFADSNKDK